jgi:hypothetical protein
LFILKELRIDKHLKKLRESVIKTRAQAKAKQRQLQFGMPSTSNCTRTSQLFSRRPATSHQQFRNIELILEEHQENSSENSGESTRVNFGDDWDEIDDDDVSE